MDESEYEIGNGSSRSYMDRMQILMRERDMFCQAINNGGVGRSINNQDNSQNKEMKDHKFKVDDFLIQEKGNKINLSFVSNKISAIFKVGKLDILNDGEKKYKVYIDRRGNWYLEDNLRIATSNEIKMYEKKDKLRTAVRKSSDRMDMVRMYKSEGRDISELDNLQLDHPDSSERTRKHCPPDDENGLSEQDLIID